MSCLALAAALFALACASGPASSQRKDGPLQHYQLARMYFEQGKVPEALAEVDRSLRLDDTLPQTHFYQGYIFWSLQRWSAAEAAFREALQLHPYYTDARMYLATCLDQQNRIDEALSELSRALDDQTYPFPEKIRVNRAVLLRRQGRLSDALTELRRAVEIKPRYYRAHYEMARLLVDMGQGEEALDAFVAAQPGYEADAEFHYRYGAALFRQNRRLEAGRELRRAMDLAPGSETAAKARDLLGVMG
ncbi:MAG: tetratricopeptide repeat protein [Acidobacteriota bacterium]|nr:MAG: tetratricopeptide repeat protein [Acidobacteriota bacterium]